MQSCRQDSSHGRLRLIRSWVMVNPSVLIRRGVIAIDLTGAHIKKWGGDAVAKVTLTPPS